MKCPVCERSCVQSAPEVLAGIDSRYMACPQCPPEPNLDKAKPLQSLRSVLWRCPSCGKAPLDVVMLDALRVLQEFRLRDESDTLRSVGSPLMAVGIPLPYPPRLGPGA